MLFSDTENNASFTYDLYAQILSDSLLDNDRAWIQYLQDHRQLIVNNSSRVEINEKVMTLYRYRMKKFLSSLGYEEELVLAFKVVNRIPNDLYFSEKYLDFVFIPNYSYITELRKMYVTLRSKVNKL